LLVLKSHGVNELRTFYGTLGLVFDEEKHGDGPTHYSGRLGDLVLEVYPLREDAGVADRTIRLGFAVAYLDEVVEALRAIGTPVTEQPRATDWGYRAVVRDPDGRAVELYQQ
jgi:catechol 2,3-dioxygenase-like lactoylglutathione lyase family enzyme